MVGEAYGKIIIVRGITDELVGGDYVWLRGCGPNICGEIDDKKLVGGIES